MLHLKIHHLVRCFSYYKTMVFPVTSWHKTSSAAVMQLGETWPAIIDLPSLSTNGQGCGLALGWSQLCSFRKGQYFRAFKVLWITEGYVRCRLWRNLQVTSAKSQVSVSVSELKKLQSQFSKRTRMASSVWFSCTSKGVWTGGCFSFMSKLTILLGTTSRWYHYKNMWTWTCGASELNYPTLKSTENQPFKKHSYIFEK